MKIDPIPSSEITPEKVYLNRRQFLKAGFAFGVGALAAAACRPDPRFEGSGITGAGAPEATSTPPGTPTPRPTNTPGPTASAPDATPTSQTSPTPTATGTPFALSEADELGDPLTDYHAITNYNNYFEFTHWKEGVANLARNFQTSPWDVQVGGLVHNPHTYAVEDLLKKFSQEERIYRLRCVEAWSMVIPWIGFPLAELLRRHGPTSRAKYVVFESLLDPDNLRGQRRSIIEWPYREGCASTRPCTR
jgi:methionine sulfoxide reductase catalytic subunit